MRQGGLSSVVVSCERPRVSATRDARVTEETVVANSNHSCHTSHTGP
ncbi:hypothetical protein Pd630_LPD00447 [Rhodococcus opacus PD630]|nr:hypothetical protein Pd630_LPD00447 [Rhodococcus opacus PD630]EJI96984.1 hypothetical protein JVH1_5303 [Rhodococcus sp. JVH1]